MVGPATFPMAIRPQEMPVTNRIPIQFYHYFIENSIARRKKT
ncbi:hypothetical protein HMPREF1985_01388 [Mitsuokella sp. oral taxon 131 str. W9106]|nr:hypothetical protein HMPREF1985_01388 [Mitsuokella sp. oral taxon 131 str. W9106]